MPLLDGKYEIHDERALGAGVTSFSATAPDGVPVRVEWLELDEADEPAFERYRRLLKRLAREGRATIQDVVARPGARYVAWYVPPETSSRGRDAAIDALIRAAGFDPEGAVVRRIGGEPRLVALPFRAPPPAPPPAPAASAPRRRLDLGAPQVRAWIASAALVAASALLLANGLQRRANDLVVVVPDVLGASYEVAAASLSRLGLIVTPRLVASDTERPGIVVAIEPAPGQTLRPGRAVGLSVALPAGQLAPTDVPRLTGLADVDVAAAALDAAGLVLGDVVRIYVDAPAGVVLGQAPTAGTTVGRGTSVDLVASLGPPAQRTFVPDLVGLGLDDARALAAIAGLAPEQVVVERWTSDREPPDTVLAQSLAPFRDVVVDDAVLRLIVASSPERIDPSALPALGGLGEAEARALAVGFAVDATYVSDASLPDGVVAQSLPPGSRPSDGPLRLTVNARPVPVPRPEVTVNVRTPAPRELAYLWFIEPGIPLVTAEVVATTLEGDRVVVDRLEVRGGGRVTGTWATSYPGVVRFDLTLNGSPYGGPIRVP